MLATILIMGLAPSTQAQPLDQAVQRALANGCQGLADPSNTTGNLFAICNPTPVPPPPVPPPPVPAPGPGPGQKPGPGPGPGPALTIGPSIGSITAQTRLEAEGLLRRRKEEEEEKRKNTKDSTLGSRIELWREQPNPWESLQPLGVTVASSGDTEEPASSERPVNVWISGRYADFNKDVAAFEPELDNNIGIMGVSSEGTEEPAPSQRRLNVWVSGGYEKFDKDVTTFEPEYENDISRGSIGADYLFSDRIIGGLAFLYRHDDGDFNAPGADFDVDSYGPLLYATFLPAPNVFISTYFEYARKDFSINRQVSLTTPTTITGIVSGNTDIDEYKTGVTAGYNIVFRNVTIGPRVGINFRRTNIDDFAEGGETGLELAYDSQRETSLTSHLGVFASAAVSTGFGILLPQVEVEWVYEFERDQRTIGFSFVDDLSKTPLQFQNDPPDRSYANVGVGLVAVLPRGFLPFVGYRAQLGYNNQSSHAVTVGLRYEF